jgi:CRP-like cAMP-binding protein
VHFGHMGLLDKKLRAASCICTEDSELMYMTKVDFGKVLEDVEKCARDLKKRFYSTIVFNYYFNLEYAGDIGSFFYDKKKYERGNVIYKQGDQVNYIYHVKHGQVELFQEKCEEAFATDKPTMRGSELSRKYKKTRRVHVAIMGVGEIFGEEEVIRNSTRICTAIASTTTKVCMMTRVNFLAQLREKKLFHDWIVDRVGLKKKSRGAICEKISELGEQYYNSQISSDYNNNGIVKNSDHDSVRTKPGMFVMGPTAKPQTKSQAHMMPDDVGMLGANKEINNNLFINNNSPETLDLIRKYNLNKTDIGALDVTKISHPMMRQVNTGGQRWLSKMKRSSRLEETGIQKDKFDKVDPLSIIED